MEHDPVLLQRFIKERDEQDFRQLYREQTPRMLSLALRLCGGHRANAEDIVQEAWFRACRLLSGFRHESKLSTWLGGIVVNCFREHSRRNFSDLEEFEEIAVPALDQHDLEDLVRRLPDRCREILVLHDIEGYTHDEIAALLGIAAGTSKHHLFRAHRKLIESVGGVRREKKYE